MLHVHRQLPDELDLVDIATEFVNASEERIKYYR